MLKRTCLSLIIFLTIAPSFASTFMDEALNTWHGYSLDDVINRFKYPDKERVIANRHLFIWKNSWQTYAPEQATSTISNYYIDSQVVTRKTGGHYVKHNCDVTFEVDKDNKIINWAWEGNSCPAFYYAGKKYVNPDNDPWLRAKLEKQRLKQERKALKKEQKRLKKEKEENNTK